MTGTGSLKHLNDTEPFKELRIMLVKGFIVELMLLPGASTGDPTHDKVMRKSLTRQGGSGLKGSPGSA